MTQLDRGIVKRRFGRAAAGYDAAAVLQAEVQSRLLERLELLGFTPGRILDLGAGTGRALKPLARAYPKARLTALDLAPGMIREARRRRPRFRKVNFAAGAGEALPFAARSFEMVFSNLMLQWCPEPDPVLGEVRRVLHGRGVFLFTTLGPDTLRELREAWRAVDESEHVHPFMDMHDIGDALVRAGFVEPVMDVEHLTMTYDDARTLMQDLRRIGARNASAGRARGLTGPRRLAAVERAYERFRSEGRLPATYEVVYGTAWTPQDLPRR